MKHRMWFLKFAVGGVLTALLGYLFLTHSEIIRRNVSARDSIAYWAAAKLLTHHQNPYDHRAVLLLEREQGYPEDRPLVLRTPPWSLVLVSPLGCLSPFGAWVVWLGFLFLCLIAGLQVTRKLYERESSSKTLLAIAAYTFAPVPACLVSGQMGLVLMVCVVLFLLLYQEHPYWAGVALLPLFAKPHLLSLFWLALAIWMIARKKTKIATGFAFAFAVATLTAIVFDPHVLTHYRQMLEVAAIQREFIPALSGVVRLLFFRRFFWVQFLPLALGVIWCLFYVVQNYDTWEWRQHGPPLLVVSVLITPYEWLSDETVLLPAILQAVSILYGIRHNLKAASKAVLGVFAFLNFLLLLILRSKIPFSTGIYFWSSLVWFAFYFYALRLQRKTAHDAEIVEVDTVRT